ncbi:MAG: DUF2933 domain-containing protein [Motilibacteraceae bacterium]
MNGGHLKHMIVGGLALLGLLLIAGVPLASALPYTVLLACPLMMIFIMSSMGGHGSGCHGHDGKGAHESGDEGDPQSVGKSAPHVR